MGTRNATCWSESQATGNHCSRNSCSDRRINDTSNGFAANGPRRSGHWRSTARKSRTTGAAESLHLYRCLDHRGQYGFVAPSRGRCAAREWTLCDPLDRSYRKSFDAGSPCVCAGTQHLGSSECLDSCTLGTAGSAAAYLPPSLSNLHKISCHLLCLANSPPRRIAPKWDLVCCWSRFIRSRSCKWSSGYRP